MAVHLDHVIRKRIAAPIESFLRAEGCDVHVTLAPPTQDDAGDLSFACHKLARHFRKAPQQIALTLKELVVDLSDVSTVEAVNGFLNIRLKWGLLAGEIVKWAMHDEGAWGKSEDRAGQRIVIEYSSPNTNKPQHLGHCRNNILGAVVANVLEAGGADVIRVNLINDRGIHICKSMVAYQAFGEGATPESTGKKGDHLIGDFYVRFETAFKDEYKSYCDANAAPMERDPFFNSELSQWGTAARKMLREWEDGDTGVRALWQLLNGWCEDGFSQTYERMGIRFDRVYKESQTYLLGKDLIETGHADGFFKTADNGAIVFPLESMGLEGEKAVLRADGTSVYMTQDIGTAVKRYDELNFDQMIYVVGNEQEHHFRILFAILGAIRPELKARCHHLSYGMVELPTGKMKSREGTVVDADDLMDELAGISQAAGRSRWPDLDESQLCARAEQIALGGLKYFLMKYAPQSGFVFDRERSLSFEGETGAYCQYAFARATSVLKKAGTLDIDRADFSVLSCEQSVALQKALLAFNGEVRMAGSELKPSLVTKALYDISKAFAAFYNHRDCRIMGAPEPTFHARGLLVSAARTTLGQGMALLGMTPLDEM
jgi:arginyl-tRNA synthetase